MRHRLQSRYWNSNSLPVECWDHSLHHRAEQSGYFYYSLTLLSAQFQFLIPPPLLDSKTHRVHCVPCPFHPLQNVHYGTRVIGPAADQQHPQSAGVVCPQHAAVPPRYPTRFRRRGLRSGRTSGSAQRASVRESGPHELLSRPRAHTGFSSASASALRSPSCLPLPFVAVP